VIRVITLLCLVNLYTLPSYAQTIKILALGDSLTAGYGLPHGEGFTDQLQKALQDQGRDVTVINAGVSGDTSQGGLARLEWSLADNPDMVIVELGANDGLRGLDPDLTKGNLDQILTKLGDRGVKTVFAGMLAPPNMGPDYGKNYNALYPALAQKHDVLLYPFFLEGVAGIPALNQDDGIHPTKDGVAIIVERILPYVTKVLD